MALAALAGLAYLPALEHDFVGLDDRELLVENRALGAGLSREGIAWALTTTADGNWIPLTWISFLADQELHGLSPRGTHATNIVLHALATALLFLAFVGLTGALGASAFVAAVFAVHPLHVESVAWAIERKDVLSAVTFGALLLVWRAHARRPRAATLVAATTVLALGLASKPMLVTAPFVLLLLDAWPLGRLRGGGDALRLVAEKLPMLALVGIVSALTLLSQSRNDVVNWGGALPLSARLENALVSAAVYLRQAVWPADLAVLYPHPGTTLSAGVVAGSAALLTALTLVAAAGWRKRPWLTVGWLWYLGMLVPVLGVVQVGVQAHADRYTYLPLVGVTLAVAFSVREWARASGAKRVAAALVAIVSVAASVVATTRQLDHWRDTEHLYRRALAVHERNAPAHAGLGYALAEAGRLDEALPHLERALELDPARLETRANLGIALVRTGAYDRAIAHLERARALPPERRWRVLAHLGIALRRTGRAAEALAPLGEALALAGGSEALRVELAFALAEAGRLGEAQREIDGLLRAGFDAPEMRMAAGGLAEARGELGNAVAHYRRALELRPGWPLAANSLAWVLATSPDARPEQAREAVALARAAVEGAGNGHASPEFLETLAVALAAAGEPGEARSTAERAVAAARATGRHDLAERLARRARTWAAGTPSP